MNIKTTGLTAVCAALLASGCASQNESLGNGEYLELFSINVIERDLSSFTPTNISRTDIATIATKKAPIPYTFTVRSGERYQVALNRWIKAMGYQNIAWSMNKANRQALDELSNTSMRFDGSFKKAVNELSDALGTPINIITDNKTLVAGVYDFDGDARITHIKGSSLKVVVERVVKNYGLRWDSGDAFSRSWLAPNDYEFGSDYYLLTPKDDIETALTTVLEEFPVYSSIVESTGQVIIQEDL